MSQQRKLLPSGCSADSEPVRTVRQVLGMLPVASSASAAGGSATRSAGSSSGARLEQLTTTAAAAAPWRPLQRQPTATSKAGAAAVAAAAVAAATAAAALTGESEEAASAPEASEASSAEARSAATGSGDASTAAAALKVSENHFAHKPQKEISETPAAAPVKTNALWVSMPCRLCSINLLPRLWSLPAARLETSPGAVKRGCFLLGTFV